MKGDNSPFFFYLEEKMTEKTTLSAFLKENAVEIKPVEYVASDRFMDNGKPVAWKLRVLGNDELDKIRHHSTQIVPIKGTNEVRKEINREKMMMQSVLASVEFPNLNDVELQDSYGVNDAEELLNAMLTPGELADLVMAVNETCGFESGMQDKIKQAKN